MSGPSRDRDAHRKWESGASKRKRKAEMAVANEVLGASMRKFLNQNKNLSTSETADLEMITESQMNEAKMTSEAEEVKNKCLSTFDSAESEKSYVEKNDDETRSELAEVMQSESNKSLSDIGTNDPGKWSLPINDAYRHDLVQCGPQQNLDLSNEYYSKNEHERHFSNFYYTRKLSNGESQNRRWLIYSTSQDKVYCFSCKLFSGLQTQMILGCNDWKHLNTILERHENQKEHRKSMVQWLSFEKGIKHGKTIDEENERLIQESQKHWFNLFERLIDIINYLASHNLAFRGHRESLDPDHIRNSGNFIDLFKLLSKYDLTLRNHLNRINEKNLNNHYLSPQIQNELISLMSQAIVNEVIGQIKKAKYYAIMLDCTRDISRVEQMSIILRYVNTSTGNIEEHFLGFLAVSETAGEFLTNVILNKLETHQLNIQNCRGQGYDNGANMVGINKGVKSRILLINPRAFFTPCGCHSWNLILVDAANTSSIAKVFFGFIQKIYVLFSKSSKRWELVKDKLKITLKSLSDTRWESRIFSVKAILFQFDDIIDCINNLQNQSEDADTLCDCQAIITEMLTLEFIISIHVWYEILNRVNNISKIWQKVDINLKIAIDNLRNFCDWIHKFRETGFDECTAKAYEFIEKSSYEITTTFKEKRVRKKKKMFNYEAEDEPIDSAESIFRIDFFITMVDGVIQDIDTRFTALTKYYNNFGFLYEINNLKSLSNDELLKHCNDLGVVLQDGESKDIKSFDLYEELQLLVPNLPNSIKDANQMIQYIIKNELEDIYPNVYIAIRIMLTVPVSTASAERSFSKLKLIKNYLRNSMKQERLSGLAMLSIEADLAAKIDYKSIVEDFSKAKSRKTLFL